MIELVVATRNPHKLREIGRILKGLPVKLRSLADCPGLAAAEETGATFEENALLKARAAAAATGWALADDSGLELDALGGAPGVNSARWAGLGGSGADAANNARLVAELGDVPEARRTGRYVCAIALVAPDRPAATFRGTVEGRIVLAPRGRGGFGYDPYFLCPPLEKTFGEAEAKEKDAVSHRGRALALLRPALEAELREKL